MNIKLMPREKALAYGFSSLTNNELLALIIKSAYKDKNVFDLSNDIINHCGGFNNLMTLSYDELITIKGIKKAKALEILAILEIAKRLSKVDTVNENNNLNPLKLVEYIKFNQGFKNQEEFFVVYLNNSGKILKSETLFKGTYNKTIVGVDELFRQALLLKTSFIVIAHNHPSGNTKPSREDIDITKTIGDACKLFGITLLDHIIISKDSYFSFKSNGLLC